MGPSEYLYLLMEMSLCYSEISIFLSYLLIRKDRKKLDIRVGGQQLQQLPRLACLSLPTSSNISKN